jgi:hypothetical protein
VGYGGHPALWEGQRPYTTNNCHPSHTWARTYFLTYTHQCLIPLRPRATLCMVQVACCVLFLLNPSCTAPCGSMTLPPPGVVTGATRTRTTAATVTDSDVWCCQEDTAAEAGLWNLPADAFVAAVEVDRVITTTLKEAESPGGPPGGAGTGGGGAGRLRGASSTGTLRRGTGASKLSGTHDSLASLGGKSAASAASSSTMDSLQQQIGQYILKTTELNAEVRYCTGRAPGGGGGRVSILDATGSALPAPGFHWHQDDGLCTAWMDKYWQALQEVAGVSAVQCIALSPVTLLCFAFVSESVPRETHTLSSSHNNTQGRVYACLDSLSVVE